MDERERVLVTLAAMRVLMGILWLSHLIWKLPPDFGRHRSNGLMHSFLWAERYAVIGPLRDLVRDEVIPHYTEFGYIVFVSRRWQGSACSSGSTRVSVRRSGSPGRS